MELRKSKTGNYMDQYDLNKVTLFQNASRELHAAYSRIAEDRRHYMLEAKSLKAIIIEGDRKGHQSFDSKSRMVKIGKWEGQEKKPAANDKDFIPLHKMPLNEVLERYKTHPSKSFINSGTLAEYVRINQEAKRLEDHFQDLTIRANEAARVVDTCMDFLKNKGFSENNLPMR